VKLVHLVGFVIKDDGDKSVPDKVSRTVSTNRRVHTDHEHYILETHTANSWLLILTANNLTVNMER